MQRCALVRVDTLGVRLGIDQTVATPPPGQDAKVPLLLAIVIDCRLSLPIAIAIAIIAIAIAYC